MGFDTALFSQFGFPALLVGVLLITQREDRAKTEERHMAERKEWLEVARSIFDRADERQAETNECIRGMTKALEVANERRRHTDLAGEA